MDGTDDWCLVAVSAQIFKKNSWIIMVISIICNLRQNTLQPDFCGYNLDSLEVSSEESFWSITWH